ncbi:MAG TPA: PD-(D/E)XK nuclease family protein, partial [Vicinamibacteria bacterium]|nr:PD-(D/E)XK nuclease family protein [Vicinamibacteria bacterium]
MNGFSWSVSRHDSFMACKRRYFYAYYEAQADPEVKRLKKLSALPMWAGNVVHETIEEVLKGHQAVPSPDQQEAIIRTAVHARMLAQWRESEAGGGPAEDGSLRFRLFEHEYQAPVDADDKKILVGTVMRSLRNFFRSDTLREAFAVGRAQWLTVEDLVSFTVEGVEVALRMDLAYRRPDGSVLIVDWKTG